MEGIKGNMMRRVAMGDCLRRSALRYPEKTAIIDGEKRMTYREFNNMANQFGNAMLNYNLAKETKIGFIGLNSAELLTTFMGAAKAGMVFLPLNPGLSPDEIEYQLDNSDAEVVVFEDIFSPRLKDTFKKSKKVKHFIKLSTPAREKAEGEDYHELLGKNSKAEVEVIIDCWAPIQLLYTTGTTAFPKGVVLSHMGVFVNSCMSATDIGFNHHDVSLAVMPLFHCAQLNSVTTTTMMVGGTAVILRQIEPKLILETIEKERVTNITLLSTLYRVLLTHPDFGKYNLSSLKLCLYFGAVMPEDLLREVMDKMCPNLGLAFGQTEMSPNCTAFKPEDQLSKMETLGNSGMPVEVGAMDDDGNLLPPGELGEFVYRSPQVMLGYYKNEEETEKAFQYGWFHSGDFGYLDEGNYVYFVDRKKDIIKTGGENVASLEVEKVIYQDPRVQEVQVLGLPHKRWGEAVTAFIIPKPGEKIAEEDIISLCKKNLTGFKVPKMVIFIEEFPRGSTGKAQKFLLKTPYQDLYEKEAG
jgi:acyl-CoA synthetase (AMP-forming)/AMP-acid ligase II